MEDGVAKPDGDAKGDRRPDRVGMEPDVEIDIDARTRQVMSLFSAAAFVVLALGLASILVFAKDLLVPIALAVLLSFTLSPIVRALQHIGAPRSIGIGVALGVAMASVAMSLWLLSGQVAEVVARLPAYQSTMEQKIHSVADRFSGSGELSRLFAMGEGVLHEVAPTADAKNGQDAAQRVVVVEDSSFARIWTLGGYASPFLSPIAIFAFVLLLTAFMLAQREDLRNRLISLIGAEDIRRTTEAIDDAGRRVGRMMFAQLALNSIFGVVVGFGLWWIGVPNPVLWGALAGGARFVPYIGVVVGLLPPLLVAFAFEPSWKAFLETLALFTTAELITGQIVEPILYGHSSGLSPVAVVISTAVWAYLWGPIGLVLATPLTICIVVIGRHVPQLGFIETMLGDEPTLEPHEMFYQRMLAGDPREAFLQAKQFLKDRTTTNYYDEIALDAVRRAHVDVVRGELDSARFETLIEAMRQLVEWLGAVQGKPGRFGAKTIATLTRVRHQPQDATSSFERPEPPDDWRGESTVAVLHEDQPLDAIAASMLAQELKRQGQASRIASLAEALAATAEQTAAVALIFLCFIEPLTLSQLRVMSDSVRKRCPKAKLVLCVWPDANDQTLIGHARRLRVDFVATSISAALSAARRLAPSKLPPAGRGYERASRPATPFSGRAGQKLPEAS